MDAIHIKQYEVMMIQIMYDFQTGLIHAICKSQF